MKEIKILGLREKQIGVRVPKDIYKWQK